MKATFLETPVFTAWVSQFLPNGAYFTFQQELLNSPLKGVPMIGCGGMRKVRIADPSRGKGKRGGARVIYLYVPEVKCFFMIRIYGKNQKADLNAAERKELNELAEDFKRQVIAKQNRAKGD